MIEENVNMVYACHSMALPEGSSEKIHLIPAGAFSGRDGRGPYALSDMEMVITQFAEQGRDLVVDYNHATDRGEVHVPAAGWITELEAREDGVWGTVAWTPNGARALKEGEYRYISPVFAHDEEGEVQRLLRAGLVNDPNLELEPPRAVMHGAFTEVRTLLGLSEEAGMAELVSSLKQRLAEVESKVPSPEEYVPRAMFDALQEQGQTSRVMESEQVVAQAVSEGKLPPALQEWARAYHVRAPEEFATFMAKVPPMFAHSGQEEGVGGVGLTAGEKKVCAALDLEPDAFVAHRRHIEEEKEKSYGSINQ